MKILEAQDTLVSNYEVYQRLLEHQNAKKKEHKKMPGTLATLTQEVCHLSPGRVAVRCS